jgi:hypothetical protein
MPGAYCSQILGIRCRCVSQAVELTVMTTLHSCNLLSQVAQLLIEVRTKFVKMNSLPKRRGILTPSPTIGKVGDKSDEQKQNKGKLPRELSKSRDGDGSFSAQA